MAAQLSQGQTDPLAVGAVTVSVRHRAAVDVSAFLLTGYGRVRGDGDMVFYNQPSGAGVRLMANVPGATTDSLVVTLGAVPAEIAVVRVVVSLDDQSARLGDYPASDVRIADVEGNLLSRYVLDGSGTASTVVAVDIERTESGWQVRAVGRDYDGGFAALVVEHGVTVGSSTPANGLPEVELTHVASAGLVPGQDVALRKQGGAELGYVKLALGWDPIRVRGRFGMRDAQVDLDASALLFAGRDLVDTAFYGQLLSRDGAVRHQGDNLTGEGKGDDEVITVDLTRVSRQVTALVFVVTSYAGHTFERVQNAFWRLVDGTTGGELARFDLLGGGAHTGMVMAKVHRVDGVWKLQAIGVPIEAQHPVEAAVQVSAFL